MSGFLAKRFVNYVARNAPTSTAPCAVSRPAAVSF